jgi:hypothetical protein
MLFRDADAVYCGNHGALKVQFDSILYGYCIYDLIDLMPLIYGDSNVLYLLS